jgi:hypothetical protein
MHCTPFAETGCVAFGRQRRTKGEDRGNLEAMSELRSCLVSYQDIESVRHTVEVTAGSLYEAAILGMKALRVPNWENSSNLEIEIRVRTPQVRHSISNAVLTAWLARRGKTPEEEILKVRLRELLRA